MIHLFTGVPGASKTLNAVKLLRESEIYQNRPVYYYNVKEVVFEDWIELSEEEVLKWYELPEGSVIFIDECQKVFRLRTQNEAVPQYVTELETHRHNGFDLVCTTQHPMLTDTAFRRQIGRHWHFERQFGFERARCLKWEKLIKDPDDFHSRKDAAVENIKFPKKYYGTYKSTELNTYKKQIPKKVYVILAMLLTVIIGATYFIISFASRADSYAEVEAELQEGVEVENESGRVVRQESTGFRPHYPLDPQEYLDIWKPRIDGLAHTAPVYDDLTKPVRAPKTICIRVHKPQVKECRCFTEQGTHLSVPLGRCAAIVDNGLYDPTLPVERSFKPNNRFDRSSPSPSKHDSGGYIIGERRELPSDSHLPPTNIVSYGNPLAPQYPVEPPVTYSHRTPTNLPPVKAHL